MGEKRADYPLQGFYEDIHSSYDRVNRIFTFGRDVSWRRKAAVECIQADPGSVLDLCTGTGDFILEIGRQVKGDVLLTGYDFSKSMLDEARKKYEALRQEAPFPSIEFLEGDVGRMPFTEGQFDVVGITFGMRNLVYENSQARRHLSEIHRVLRSGGHLVILESARPIRPLWRFFNSIYLQFILPYLGGLISGNLAAYRYLGKSSKNYYTIGEMGQILENAGFNVGPCRSLFLGSVMMVVATKK